MILSMILYSIAGVLAIYILVSIIKEGKFTTEIAVALLGIVVSIILAQRTSLPNIFGQNTDQTPINSTPTATASSISLVLDIRPACGDTYTVEAEKPFNLRYGTWFARGIEKAIDNSDHLSVTLAIDGQIIPGTKQTVQPVNSSWPGAACGGSIDFEEGYGLFYIAHITPLSAGEHSVQISYTLDAQVTDGYTDSNNNPNTYGPGQVNTLNIIFIAK